MKYLLVSAIALLCWMDIVNADTVHDESRGRFIPTEITFPRNVEQCSAESKCPVALLSAGYGVSHLKYTFISKQLNKLNYLVIAIGHELPNDPALSVSGDLYETRSENWSRGAQTLDFIKTVLSERFSKYDFEKITLIGHSNGGDISAWLANESKLYVGNIITLDHRRVPLPRNSEIKVLSIRASDFPADKGVLPTKSEQEKFLSCIVNIPKAKHNDITDFGPEWLTFQISVLIKSYLNGQSCSKLMKI